MELFFNDRSLRTQVTKLLSQVQDLERTATRLRSQKAGPRDLKALQKTLTVLPELQAAMTKHKAVHAWLKERKPLVDSLTALIAGAIVDDAPVKASHGGFIKNGYDKQLDALRHTASEVETWFVEQELKERKATGISSLKVGANSALGVYIEVGKTNQAQVPKSYEHLQSLKDKVRFTRTDLRQRHAERQLAGERAREREQELLKGLTDELVKHADSLKLLSKMIARVDVYASLAEVAATHGYVRPQIGMSELVIDGGRHPVVERHARFMRNDLEVFRERAEAYLRDHASTTPALVRLEWLLAEKIRFVDAHLPLFLASHEIAGTKRYDNYKKSHHVWNQDQVTRLLTEARANGEADIADIAFTADAILASFSPPLLAYQRQALGYSLERVIAGVTHVFIDGLRRAAPIGGTAPHGPVMGMG